MTELPGTAGLDALNELIAPLAQRFADGGHRLYLVGGVVRDLFLAGDGPFDPAANDIDLTTDAEPAVIKGLLSPLAESLWAQGERFGTIGASIGGHALEITTHRAEAYDQQSRKPVVTFGRDLNEDLSRRDFTINAAAIEVPSGVLHDPFHGIGDLTDGRLRTPLSPTVSFTDDPLRMMRAARFISRFQVRPAEELVAATVELAERLEIVSVERVADELERLLQVPDPRSGLSFLADTGLLAHILLQTDDFQESVALAGSSGDPLVRRAGLLWPLRSGAAAALSRLKYSRADTKATTGLLAGVERGLTAAASESGVGDSVIRRIAARLGSQHLDSMSALAANLGREAVGVSAEQCGRLIEAVDRVQGSEDLSDLQSPLTGGRVMELLELQPGPQVGRAQRHLRELRLELGPLNERQAEQALLEWWRAQ